MCKPDNMSNQIHIHVTVVKDVPAEKQQKWLEMAKELASETWKEDGCISYDFVRSTEKQNRFIIVEEWESQAHLDAHFNTPHFQTLVPLMDGMSETVELDVSQKALAISRHNDTSSGVSRKHRNGRILVLYDTSSGSTAMIADLIAEGVKLLDKMDVRVRVVPGAAATWEKPETKRDISHPFATFNDVYWADGIACGTPTNLGGISYRMKQFWDEFSQAGGWGSTDGKIATAFTSQGGHGGGGELAAMAMQTVLMNFGFSCFGITDYTGFLDTNHYGSIIAKKPRNLEDKRKCRRQGLRLAEFVGYYINGRDEANPVHTKNADIKFYNFPGIPSRSVPSDVLDERTSAPHVSLEGRSTEARKALIFTKMEDYVHDSTPAMASWVLCKLQEFGWKGVVTDDKDFLESEEKLSAYDLVVFLNNSGQIFDKTEALMKHIEQGKGVVGVHAAIAAFLNGKDASGATVMEPTSEIFHTIFGSHFKNHPPVQKGKVSMNFKNDLGPNLVSVPSEFMHTDEFFNFTKNVYDDPSITVVASLDESTTDGGLMGERHPLAWYRNIGEQKAPVFYSALGHFSHFYNGTGGADSEYVTTILEAGLRYCCDNS
ncbi:unnamed protein product [Cylindrotheca closterium]|uniref:ABM domain-containing protein n=1 Tax=Cylindrotheca closterium TaxID=2856 RepID=A0AAD2PVE2_9STRA|nr:unnamed protein product [Cylindrotheca closterium]